MATHTKFAYYFPQAVQETFMKIIEDVNEKQEANKKRYAEKTKVIFKQVSENIGEMVSKAMAKNIADKNRDRASGTLY